MEQKAEKVIKKLGKIYKIKIWKANPFKVLIACILSQRTKDEITRKATQKLFSKASTPEKILKLKEKEIEELIYPVGFYREKAKRIKKICKILLKQYKGKVPSQREELLKLPGVGSKTADVVLAYGFGKPVVAVDTHVFHIARRLGLSKGKTPEEVRNDLNRIVPKKFKRLVNLLFVEFGKEICRTNKPKCEICPVKQFCEYFKQKRFQT